MTSQQDRFGRHFVYGPGLRLAWGQQWPDGVLWDEVLFQRERTRIPIPRRGAWNLMAVHQPDATDAAWEARERESTEVAVQEPTPQPQRASRGIQRATAGEMPA